MVARLNHQAKYKNDNYAIYWYIKVTLVHQDTPETNLNHPAETVEFSETLSLLFKELSDWNYVLKNTKLHELLNNIDL